MQNPASALALGHRGENHRRVENCLEYADGDDDEGEEGGGGGVTRACLAGLPASLTRAADGSAGPYNYLLDLFGGKQVRWICVCLETSAGAEPSYRAHQIPRRETPRRGAPC